MVLPFAAITAASLFKYVSTSFAHLESEIFAHFSLNNLTELKVEVHPLKKILTLHGVEPSYRQNASVFFFSQHIPLNPDFHFTAIPREWAFPSTACD